MQTILNTVKNIQHRELLQLGKIERTFWAIFHSYGFKMLNTPLFEAYDNYSKYLPHLRNKFIKSIDTDGTVLVLRPDVTLPLVQSLAKEYKDNQTFLKYAYISDVFLPYQGRHKAGNSFVQAGAEILGSSETACDSEIIEMSLAILDDLKITRRQVDIGSVAFTNGFFEELNLTEEQLEKLKVAIDARNMTSLQEYCQAWNLNNTYANFLLALPMLLGPYEVVISKARSLCINQKMVAALERLERVIEKLHYVYPEEQIYLDFASSNRLNYYTDIIFKIYAPGAPYALADGGRYDNLSKEFGVPRPACGFGMNLNLLAEYLEESNLQPPSPISYQLLVQYTKADQQVLSTIYKLRKQGMSVVSIPYYGKFNEEDYTAIAKYDNGNFEVVKGQDYLANLNIELELV